MTFFESSSRSIFLFEHDLSGKPVPTFPDHALRRKGAPLWLDSRAIDDLEISAAVKRVKFPSGPQRTWADRISDDLLEAGRPQLLIDHDEISRRPRTRPIDQDGIACVGQPGTLQILSIKNCQRVGVSPHPVVRYAEQI